MKNCDGNKVPIEICIKTIVICKKHETNSCALYKTLSETFQEAVKSEKSLDELWLPNLNLSFWHTVSQKITHLGCNTVKVKGFT